MARKVRKSSKPSKSSVRKMSVSKRASKKSRKVKARKPQLVRRPKPAAPVSSQRAADEVPTLEQVTITCANCGRPFKVLKLVEDGKIKVKSISTPMPSPFAFNIVLEAHTDVMRIEDKQEFLKRMHQKVLAKIGEKAKTI